MGALKQTWTNDVKRHNAFLVAWRTLLLAAIVLAVGCSRFGNAMLQFSPASFSDCKGPNIVVHVSWDAMRKTKGPVTILVYKPGRPPVVWMPNVAPAGAHDTGEWMSDGSTMRLVDAKGRLLAMRTLETTACE